VTSKLHELGTISERRGTIWRIATAPKSSGRLQDRPVPQITPGAVPAGAGLTCIEPGHPPCEQSRQPSGGERGPQERRHLTLRRRSVDRSETRDKPARTALSGKAYARARAYRPPKDHRSTAKPSRPSESVDGVISPRQSERVDSDHANAGGCCGGGRVGADGEPRAGPAVFRSKPSPGSSPTCSVSMACRSANWGTSRDGRAGYSPMRARELRGSRGRSSSGPGGLPERPPYSSPNVVNDGLWMTRSGWDCQS
jgi:hypothetical protein